MKSGWQATDGGSQAPYTHVYSGTRQLAAMVAPHTNKPITHSFVRILGSGRGNTSDFQVHDFSRVSSAAAVLVARDPFLRRSSGQRQQVPQTSSSKVASVGAVNGLRIRQVESGQARSTITRETNPSEQPRQVASSGSSVGQAVLAQNRGGRSIKRPCDKDDELSPQTPSKLPRTLPSQRGTQGQEVTHESSGTAQSIPPPPAGAMNQGLRMVMVSCAQLVEERDRLQQQNKVLSREVMAFRQIFNDMDKLTRVLQVLGIVIVGTDRPGHDDRH